MTKPWWWPELSSGEEDDTKYRTTWDHVGDAYEEYEHLADAFLKLIEQYERETGKTYEL